MTGSEGNVAADATANANIKQYNDLVAQVANNSANADPGSQQQMI